MMKLANFIRAKLSLSFILIIFTVFIIRATLIDLAHIPSSSMEPTLKPGDMVIVNKGKYGLRIPLTNTYLYRSNSPKVGEVVTFEGADVSLFNSWIKRVVAVAGDSIKIDNKEVFINGEKLICINSKSDIDDRSCEEVMTNGSHYKVKWSNKAYSKSDFIDEYLVPKNHTFLMGDNRNNSYDSRFLGAVHIDKVYGQHIYTIKGFKYLNETILTLLCILLFGDILKTFMHNISRTKTIINHQ